MTFDPIFPFSVIILLLVPFTIFLLWQESKKKHRFLAMRIVSILLLMLALAGIMLHSKLPGKKLSKVILLTQGYSEKKIDSLVRQHPQWSLMHLPAAKPFKNSQLLPEIDLPHHSSEIQIVVGQGIPRHHLDRMHNKAFQFVPGVLPGGITSLSISRRNLINRKNTIRGNYNSLHGNVFLYLNGPGGPEDSVEIGKKGENQFGLSFIPKQAGQFIYTITVKDSTKTIHENLPVQVEDERNLNIVFLLPYPTFEAQYLKNFLARKNNRLVLRYQVSKNNFRYEYVNHERVSFNLVNNILLANADLIVSDAMALSALSPVERNDLQEAIHAGLGLLNLSVINNKNLRAFFPFETTSVKTDTAHLKMASRSFSLPAARFRVANGLGVFPLVKSNNGILTGYSFHGAGKIGFQLVQETYRLRLAGDSVTYAEIWTPLLERLARSQSANSKISIVTPFPWYEEEPIDIKVISSNENFSLRDDGVEIPIREDITLDNIWHARTWGGKSGWHTLQTSDETELRYYTLAPSGWMSLSVANQMQLNGLTKTSATTSTQSEARSWEDIPPIIFYLTFVCAAGFIWIAPKL